MNSGRNFNIDIIRSVACIMVIVMHSPNPGSNLSGIVSSGVTMFSMPCIGLFFICSGALLLPVETTYRQFVTRRLKKVVWPTFFFSLFYLLVKCILGEYLWNDLICSLLSIPFSPQGNGTFWFMYVLIGVYIAAPIISPWLKGATKEEIQFVLILWFITLCWPYLKVLPIQVSTNENSMLYNFSGYLGYFVLGYYLRMFPIRCKWYILTILLVLPFVVYPILRRISIFQWGYADGFSYLSVFIACMTISWWTILSRLNADCWSYKVKKFIEEFSNCSFGIYLVHIFIIRKIIWNFDLDFLPPFMRLLTEILLGIILSLLVVKVLSRLSYGKYIVGYEHR